jgi:hypothetical protein
MVNTASSSGSSSGGLFGGLFNAKAGSPSGAQQTNTIASKDTSAQDHSGFFGNLFKPQTAAVQQTPVPQGAVLAGLSPVPEPRKIEQAKTEAPKAAPQKPEPQIAETPRPKTRQQQDATATPPANSSGLSKGAQPVGQPTSTGSLIKGAQPMVPAGTFDGRWAGLQ